MNNVRYLPITVDAGSNPQAWRDDALCRETDPNLFFPEKGQPVAAAKQICGACDARQSCLDDALEHHDTEFGIRGGLTANQRKRILAEQRRTAVAHLIAETAA